MGRASNENSPSPPSFCSRHGAMNGPGKESLVCVGSLWVGAPSQAEAESMVLGVVDRDAPSLGWTDASATPLLLGVASTSFLPRGASDSPF